MLLPNFAIRLHATGTCVSSTALSVPVSHTIHTNWASKIVDPMEYTNFFLYIFIANKWYICLYVSTFAVQADSDIKDMTFLDEYAGDSDYLEN